MITKASLKDAKALGILIVPTKESDLKRFANVAKYTTYEVLEITENRVYYALNCGERHSVVFTKLRADELGNFILVNKEKLYLKDMLKGLTWTGTN